MSIPATVNTLNAGTSAVNGNANGTGVYIGSPSSAPGIQTVEGILIIQCVAVASAGNVTFKLQGSVDRGKTWSDLVKVGGTVAALTATTATGLAEYRYANVPPYLRYNAVLNSGTSVTVVMLFVGIPPVDSTYAVV